MIQISSLRTSFFLLLLGVMSAVQGQNIPDGIGTAAVSTTDATGKPWGYIRWSSNDPALLKNQRWAIYGRPGTLTSSGTFTRQGLAVASADPSVIKVRLGQAEALGDDTLRLQSVLSELLSPARWNGPQNGPLEQQISAAMNRAAGEEDSAQTLRALTTGYPTMALVQGEAWAQRLPVAIGQPYTFEVRQAHATNPALDGPVLTRVQLTAGQATALPAAGMPQQICDVSPRGHLAIKLWWPTSAALRKVSLSIYGYNLYRTVAGALPSTLTVTPTVLRAQAKKVNTTPIIPKEAAPELIPPNPTDETAPYYFADDNGMAAKEPGATPHVEGMTFDYYVVARDLLGAEGTVSARGLGVAVSTLPPLAPTDLEVEEITTSLDGSNVPIRRLQLSWTQTADDAAIRTDEYWVYRGARSLAGGPIQPMPLSVLEEWNSSASARVDLRLCRILVTPHQVGLDPKTKRTVIDVALPPTTELMDQTLWFAVQPIHTGPAGCSISGSPTPPAFGQFRTTAGPAAPEGSASFSCPRIALGNFKDADAEYSAVPSAGIIGYSYEAVWHRHDVDVAWVEAYIVSTAPIAGARVLQGRSVVTEFGRVSFAPESEELSQSFTVRFDQVPGHSLMCRTGSDLGAISCWHERPLPAFENRNLTRLLRFQSEAMTGATVDPADWRGKCLLIADHGEPLCLTPSQGTARADGSLTGLVTIDPAGLPPEAASGVWDGVCLFREPHRVVGAVTLRRMVAPIGIAGPSFPANSWSFALNDPEAGSTHITRYCISVFREAPAVCAHAPRPANTSALVPINVFLSWGGAVQVMEYRLFRSLNDDTPSLIKQDAQDFNAAGISSIVAQDTAMPKTAGVLRYYAQTADKHGNASPMRLIATVPLVIKPAAPTLDKPETLRDGANDAIVKLRWVCRPEGVQRFLVRVVPEASAASTEKKAAAANAPAAPVATVLPAQGSHLFTAPTKSITAQSLLSEVGAAYFLLLQQSYYTPSPGQQGFAPGPDFTTDVRINPSGKYKAWIEAIDANGTAAAKSAIRSFEWKEPTVAAPGYEIPWPARPLPQAAPEPAVSANGYRGVATVLWHPAPEPRVPALPGGSQVLKWPTATELGDQPCLGVRIGSWPHLSWASGFDVIPGVREFRGTASLQDKLMLKIGPTQGSLMLYRQQVPTARLDKVSGATIQCSDRVEGIVTKPVAGDGYDAVALLDPRIGLAETPFAGGFAFGGGGFNPSPPESQFFLLDQQPQLSGAAYRYTLVHYRPDGEIASIYPAGTVTMP
jgi:hypothetical protein